MKRAIFEITWRFDKKDPNSPDPGWVIRGRGVDAGPDDPVYAKKADAVRAGRQIARAARPSQLIIKGKNGRVQTESTYGSDPERFPG